MLTSIIAIVAAYLIGSISSAVIVCKAMGLPDPRKQGSKNPGATNVLRIGGKTAASLTLIGDVLKGFIPVLAAISMELTPLTIAGVMFAAFMGHLYPVFFKFEGGKGVATLIGCLLALNFLSGLAFLFTWVVVALAFRYSSLASLLASLFAPLYVCYFTHNNIYYVTVLTMSLILIYRHRSNIEKLAAGKEHRIGSTAR